LSVGEATVKRRKFISLVGGAIAWPLVAGAESIRNKYRLAILTPSALNRDYRPIKEFFNELTRSGYVEGHKIIIEVFSTDGNSERRSEVAHDAVRGNPDAIFVMTGPLTQHVKEATARIPISCITADPVALGLTISLARPSGNVTGVVVDAGIEGWSKKLQLLREVAPKAKRIGFLARQAVWEGTETPAVVRTIRAAAETFGVDLLGVPVASPMQEAEYRHAFETITTEKIEGLVVQDAPEHLVYSQLIVDLVAKAKIPAVYPYRSFAKLGGLITYAVDEVKLLRYAATQTSVA